MGDDLKDEVPVRSGNENSIPACYMIGREIDEKELPTVHEALEYTPVLCAIVSNIKDGDMARKFSRDVIQAESADEAIRIALHLHVQEGRIVLVITDGSEFTPIYGEQSC